MRVTERERYQDVAILSDGIERLALDFTSHEAHNGFFSGLDPRYPVFQYQGPVAREGVIHEPRINFWEAPG